MLRVSSLFADLLLVLVIVFAVQIQSRLLLPIAIPSTNRTLIELNSYFTLGLISIAVIGPTIIRVTRLLNRTSR